MTRPTRSAQILDLLPAFYATDPLLRRVVEAVAGRLAEAQDETREVMNAHWVDAADRAPLTARQNAVDLPRIAALVPLVPFPEEAVAQPVPAVVRVDPAAIFSGQNGFAVTFAALQPGQQLYAAGTAPPAESAAVLQALRIQVGRPLLEEGLPLTVEGRLLEIEPATAAEPQARLVLLTGTSGVEMFRQRLKLTVEAFIEGAGTAPAILKMAAATMGWGPLEGTFADWSAGWTPSNPVFEARATGAPRPIRLRELPLRPATTSQPRRVKAGDRWQEINDSSFVVAPRIEIKTLGQPVAIPTLVSLDAEVAIAAVVVLETEKLDGAELVEQDVTLRLEGRPDGSLSGSLIERRLATGVVTTTDVTDRIRVRASGLQIDRPGAAAFLTGGDDDIRASLVIGDGRRAIRLTARGQGLWGNAIRVAHAEAAPGEEPAVELSYDPALAVGQGPSAEDAVYVEQLTLDQLTGDGSRLVEGRDFTFTIPAGESNWLYFDHFFDQSPSDLEDPDALLADYPANGIFGYSTFDNAAFTDKPEPVEVQLGWQEGQRATIRLDVPLASQRDRERLAFLPEMIRRVKAAGIKMILVPRFVEKQPLGERPPRAWPRSSEHQPLGERVRTQTVHKLAEEQPLNDRVAGVFDRSHFGHARFGARF